MKTAGLLAFILIPLLISCLPKKPELPRTEVPAGPLIRELERKRASFRGLTALASVEISKRGGKRTFDSVGIVVDGLRRFRIEAYGPLGESLIALVWNGRDLLVRSSEDNKVVRQGPDGLERLLGKGIEAEDLCTILSGNIPLPDRLPGETLLCSTDGGCSLEMHLADEDRIVNVSWQTPLQSPQVLSYVCERSGTVVYQVMFDHFSEIAGYQLPRRIEIRHPATHMRITIRYNEVEVNTPVSDDAFFLTGGAEQSP